ncbi:sensor histidine kinase [Rubrivirga sp.]|uniref:sensor histidine kinase n=1 Tax=Rubrivirga sp. TaxID=1885344 RepID=UPI003C780560
MRSRTFRLSSLIGWFVLGERTRLETFRYRFFVIGSWAIAAVVALITVVYAKTPGVEIVAVASFAFLIIPAIGLPFLLRVGVSLELLSVALVVIIQAALAFSAFLDRGLHDVALLWLVATPLFAAFVAGPKTGIAIAFTAAIAGGSVLVGTEMGYVFPLLMSETAANRYFIANFVIVSGFVAALAWAYEGPISKYLRDLARNLEETNEELRQELEGRRKAQHAAEAASRAKDALLANLSHEFRTPLTAIVSGAEVLDLEASDDDRVVIDSMHRGAHRLLATLDGVLDLTRLEGGNADLEVEPVNAGAIVRTVASRYEKEASAKGIELHVVAPDVHARADQAALERVVTALTDNAIRFTVRGYVGLGVALEGEAVQVVIADTGIGMTPEFASTASEPFQQASEGHGRSHEGLGLGLAIARGLAESMGGRLEIDSEPGRGTTVTVTLPVARPVDQGPGAALARPRSKPTRGETAV